MLPTVLVLCLFGPTAWLPASVPASGDAKPRIAIAPIGYSAGIPEHTKTAVHATATEAVQGIAQSALLLDVDAECRTRDCALRQARDANAELLLELQITLDQRDYAIEINVLSAADGRPVTQTSGECRLCAQAELLVAIAAQVAALEPALEREQPVAIASADGPLPSDMPSLEPRSETRAGANELALGGWLTLALGLAGVGTGAALVAIDGREHGPTCAVTQRDINGACPNVYTTQLAGIITATAGGVALASGVGLLIASKGKRRRGAAARLSPALGGLRIQF